MERIRCHIIWGIILLLAWRDLEKPRNISVRIDNFRLRFIPSTSWIQSTRALHSNTVKVWFLSKGINSILFTYFSIAMTARSSNFYALQFRCCCSCSCMHSRPQWYSISANHYSINCYQKVLPHVTNALVPRLPVAAVRHIGRLRGLERIRCGMLPPNNPHFPLTDLVLQSKSGVKILILDDCKEYCLSGYEALYSGRSSSTFWRNVLSPSSG